MSSFAIHHRHKILSLRKVIPASQCLFWTLKRFLLGEAFRHPFDFLQLNKKAIIRSPSNRIFIFDHFGFGDLFTSVVD